MSDPAAKTGGEGRTAKLRSQLNVLGATLLAMLRGCFLVGSALSCTDSVVVGEQGVQPAPTSTPTGGAVLGYSDDGQATPTPDDASPPAPATAGLCVPDQLCVSCSLNSHCPAVQPVCASGICRRCQFDQECAQGATCDNQGRCQQAPQPFGG